MPVSRRRIAGLLLSILGFGLLAWQIHRVGLDTIREHLSRVGWGFLGIVALSFVRYVLRAVAWTTLIGERVPIGRAVAATISGDAIGNLTPLSLLVSEPAKAMYLRDHVPPARAFAALAAENFFYSVSVALFIVAGTAVLLQEFVVSGDLRRAALVALALMAMVLAAALWIIWRRPAIASETLRRIPFGRLDAAIARVREFETKAYEYAGQGRGTFAIVAGCECGFHLISFAESWLTLWLVTGVSAPLAAFVLDTFNRIVNVVFRMVPFKAGVDEYSSGIVAAAVGFAPATGVTLALVRKGRVLVWAALGLLYSIRRS